ncbi:MAG: anthranilate synthase component I family protein [Kiritimatiellae bacterium]|nr:anthranilate synthase component I family protein [Kiritimatiellia bacterium]
MILDRFPDKAEFDRQAAGANVVPVGVRVLADTETPVSVLGRFMSGRDPLFLFESAEGGERWGRYSFMGLSCRARVTVYREDVVVRNGIHEERTPHGGDPLRVLRAIAGRYRQAHLPGLPRFAGGLVGYIAYEMVHFFEPRVPNRLPAEKPLADFMIPDLMAVFDNVQHTLTALALAFIGPDDNPDHCFEQARARAEALAAALEQPAPLPSASSSRRHLVPKATMPEEHFREVVRRVKQHVYDGDVIQAVLSQSFVCQAPENLLDLYRAQRFINPSPYLYFLRLGDTALAGSSPETMVRLDLRTACLRPIAGTRPRGADEVADRDLADELLKDEKERAEHLMLVDLGRNELGRVAIPGTVQVTDLMVVERYSHVMHLVSNIVAELEPTCDAFDLLRASFPAGTLSGAPKVRAMELIAELETEPRGPYGGAVGYIGFDGNMDFAICIRTAHVEGERLTVRAGAGLVADSDPERERVETVNKARSVARALELLKIQPVP